MNARHGEAYVPFKVRDLIPLVVTVIVLSCADSTPKDGAPSFLTLTELRSVEVSAFVSEGSGGFPPDVAEDDLEARLRSRLVEEGVTVLGAPTVSSDGKIDLHFGAPSITVWVRTQSFGDEGQAYGHLIHMQIRVSELATIHRTSRVVDVPVFQSDAVGYAPVDTAGPATLELLDQLLDQFFAELRELEAIHEEYGPR